MLSVLAGLLLAAPLTVAAPGLRSYGVDAKLVDAWLDRMVTVLSAAGVKVTSHSDLEQTLGLERQRQLLGCADSGSSCLAELAGALGVDTLLVGSVVKSESGFTVTLRFVSTKNGQELAAASGRFRDEGALLDWLDQTTPELASRLKAATGHGAEAGTTADGATPGLLRWSPAIVGAAALIIGVVFIALAQQVAAQLQRPGMYLSAKDIDGAAGQGSTYQTAGWVLSGVGVAAIAAGTLWGLLGGSRSAHLSLGVVPGGAFVGLQGSFP